jgi:hypothetical protein
MTCKLIFTQDNSKRRETREFDSHSEMVGFFKRDHINYLMSVWDDKTKQGRRTKKGAK